MNNNSHTHKEHNYRGAGYIGNAYRMEQRRKTIRKMVAMIRKSAIQFDTIVFRGMSGALIGPAVADVLEVPFLLIRKSGDGSHSCRLLEGHADIQNYIIVDDLIGSGDTIRAMFSALRGNGEEGSLSSLDKPSPDAKCLGIFLYNNYIPKVWFRDETTDSNIPIFALYQDGTKLKETTIDAHLKYPKKVLTPAVQPAIVSA